MENYNHFNLTHCSNIYPGNSWEEIFNNLKVNIPLIKAKLSPTQPFGIGLRLSYKAAFELSIPKNINIFKNWLYQNNCYVTTINGFVYGEFSNTSIKETVYDPDWSTKERYDFNYILILISSMLCLPGKEIGFSTSPLGYKFGLNKPDTILKEGSEYLLSLLELLIEIYKTEGKLIHIDFEPEADCILESIDDIVKFFNQISLKIRCRQKMLLSKAKKLLCRHVRICYDICHQAVQFEDHIKNFDVLNKTKIKIGKIQISSALDIKFCQFEPNFVVNELEKFNDNIYLHQAVERKPDGTLSRFRDLPEVIHYIQNMSNSKQDWLTWNLEGFRNVRLHFHVPIYIQNIISQKYAIFSTTYKDIIAVIEYIKHFPITSCLEIETYTWEVLPKYLKLDLLSSIIKEYEWVIKEFRK
uniref:hypothetical protein n=1 Tax=Neustupella aerophytica TaxID=2962111 RepID=UPI0021823AD3|nr:hypothetical protein N4K71_pgp085 [Neustupella aerophytica]UVI61114.1 hypothetical protein [Neustupella aerophytica]